MPLVLVTGAATESGHVYDDVVGVRYEYPAMYRGMIAAGESFVHYRGGGWPVVAAAHRSTSGAGPWGPRHPWSIRTDGCAQ